MAGQCDLIYSYFASELPKVLRFKIFRIDERTDADALPLLADECLVNELVWYNAEYDFPIASNGNRSVAATDYQLGRLEVGDRDYSELITRKDEPGFILFECELGAHIPQKTYIKYRCTLPVERESAISITSEFVTKSSTIKFDYAALGDRINPLMLMCPRNSRRLTSS